MLHLLRLSSNRAKITAMSKQLFRSIVLLYVVIQLAAAFRHILFNHPISSATTQLLNQTLGTAVSLPQPLGMLLGLTAAIVFVWSILGLLLFWPSSRPLFLLLFVGAAAFAAIRRPFYIVSNWSEVLMQLQMAMQGFLIAITYFGPAREFFSRREA